MEVVGFSDTHVELDAEIRGLGSTRSLTDKAAVPRAARSLLLHLPVTGAACVMRLMAVGFNDSASREALRVSIAFVCHELLLWARERSRQAKDGTCGLYDIDPAQVVETAVSEFALMVAKTVRSQPATEKALYKMLLEMWQQGRLLPTGLLRSVTEAWGC